MSAIASRAVLFSALTPLVARGGVLVVFAAASLAGVLMTDADQTARAIAAAGSDWANLLRAMAGLKLLFALSATAAVWWRLGFAVSPLRFAAYAAAGAATWVGPGLIWGLVQVGAGAALLHGGLVATSVLLWRDPAVSARLADAVARRRRAIRARS